MKFINTSTKSRGLGVLIVLLGLVISSPLYAKDIPVRVGYVHFPPWQIAKQGKFVGGIDKIILDTLIERLARQHDIHLKPTYVRCPLKRCLAALEAGQLDLKTGLLYHLDRETYLHFIQPPYQESIDKAFYLHKDSTFDIESLGDLASHRIGVSRASKNFPEFDQNKDLNKVLTNGTHNGLQMLQAKRFDAFLGTEFVVDYIIANNAEFSAIKKASYKYRGSNAGYFALSKNSGLVKYLPQISQVMKEIVEEGLVQHAVKDVLKPAH